MPGRHRRRHAGRRRCLPGAPGARQARREIHAAGDRPCGEAGCLPASEAGSNQAGSGEVIPEIGHFALALALIVALLQSGLPLIAASRGAVGLMESARSMATGQFVFVAIAFGALTAAYVASDFTVFN